MSADFLGERRRAMEESFFAAKDRELLENLRREAQAKEQRLALGEICGVTDDNVLDKLLELELGVETVAALSLIPLIEVAWADGSMESKEREAISSAAAEQGIAANSAASNLLLNWLDSRPDQSLLDAWKSYVGELSKSLDAAGKEAVHSMLLDRAQRVAEAAGGILGLGNKVSPAEQAVLQDLASALG